jgi:hypothetical protein
MSEVQFYPWFIGAAGTRLLTGMARDGIRKKTRQVHRKAEQNLERARASGHTKIADPGGLTEIGSFMDGDDGVVWMSGYKNGAMAIEFGHAPSGVFAGTSTKAPEGLYILIRAAGLSGGK